jgi:hypothetical protein
MTKIGEVDQRTRRRHARRAKARHAAKAVVLGENNDHRVRLYSTCGLIVPTGACSAWPSLKIVSRSSK